MHTLFNLQSYEMAATLEHQLRTDRAAHLARLGPIPHAPLLPLVALRAILRRVRALLRSAPVTIPERPRACAPASTTRRCAGCGGPVVRRAALARPGRPSRCVLRRRRPQLERRW
jgi:hypothetical protein